MTNSKNFCETDFLLNEPAQIVDFYTTTCDTTCDQNRYKSINNNTNSEIMKTTELVPRPRLVNPNPEPEHDSDSYVIHSEESATSETESDDNNIAIDIKDTEHDTNSLVVKKNSISAYNLNICCAITGSGLLALTLELVYNYM